jgi:aspartokinase
MVTISRVVEKVVEENPFIQEAISRGLINYAALAEEMRPRIEQELKTSVKESAVMMALRRLAEKLEGKTAGKARFSKNSDVFVKSDLFEITIKKSRKTFSLLQEIYDHIDHENDFLSMTQGVSQVTIISNKRNKKKISEILSKEQKVKEIDNLAAVSTTLPLSATNEVGFFYVITRAFAWENIPIVEAVSTLTELTLIVDEKDVPKAFTTFKDVIGKNN